MTNAITLSEFREMSASAMQALQGTILITENGENIGLLPPVRNRTLEEVAARSAKLDALEALRTPEVQAGFDVALARRERR